MKPSWYGYNQQGGEIVRITIYDLRIKIDKSEIVNHKSEIIKSRSSVWLEHYTDNVGVSSSNLLGTTLQRSCRGELEIGD